MKRNETHKRLRLARLRLELKAQDVAARIGVSRSALSQYERYGVPLPCDGEARLMTILGQPCGATATAPGAGDVGQNQEVTR
jgi:DNA-binding transcriptional regulator YiaG